MTKLELELELCKKDFRFFTAYVHRNLMKADFTFYKFHSQLSDVLINLENTNGARLIINAPFRIGKTELVKCYIAWRFLRNPMSSVIYISYGGRLASRKNGEIRAILLWLAKRFEIPELRMTVKSDSKTEWINKSGGTILALGSNNDVTGAGCDTALIIDDPNKPADRMSAKVLEKRNRIFSSTIRNRINNPNVPIVVIQQRIAARDLTGYLTSEDVNERWTKLKFSGITESGEALCPERFPLEEIERYKSDPFTYNAQILQDPLDDIGRLFDKNKIFVASVRPPTTAMRLLISCDSAKKDTVDNDFNAISVLGMHDGNFYILEVLNFHADVTVLVPKLREVAKRWGEQVPMLIESGGNGSAAVQILRKERGGVLEVSPCVNKVERAIAVKYLFDAMNVKFCVKGLVWGEIVSQFSQFPYCIHDDIVDSVVQGIDWLSKLPSAIVARSVSEHVNMHRPVFGGHR